MGLNFNCAIYVTHMAVIIGQALNTDHSTSQRSLDGNAFKGPTFYASPQNLSVPEGSDVSFPCDYEYRGTEDNVYMMIFKYVSAKNEDRIYYAGDTKVAHFPRIAKQGKSFILSNVKDTDGGNYVCRFETKPLTQISHRLEVLYPPKVYRESLEITKVTQGSSVALQCSAEGNPPPTITWSRQGGLLPSGAQSEQGYSIELEDVDSHVEGVYTCTASNGIGTSASASMTVQVEYPPEIISEQSIIHTGEGDDAKLVCVVHGRPPPDVMWLRGDSLVSSGKHMMTHDGAHRHILTIIDVTEEDFGEYTCKAYNSLGNSHNTFELTGLPRKPQITSSKTGDQNSYTLLLSTETSSPLVQYRLKYRKVDEKRGKEGQWRESLYFPYDKNITQVRQGVYQIRHILSSVYPGEAYDIIVQVENKFGWSSPSDLFHFQTEKEETTTTSTTMATFPQTFNHGPKVEEVAVGTTANNGISYAECRIFPLITLSTVVIFSLQKY